MINREKVIKGLACCLGDIRTDLPNLCTICPYAHDYYATQTCGKKLKEDALTLLKAQEPVLDIDEWKCGNCGHVLEHQQLLGDNVLLHEQYNYCPECGRMVKWE